MQTGRGVRAIQRVTEPIKVTKIGVLQPICVPRLSYGLCTYRLLRSEDSLLWMRQIIKRFKDTIRPTNQGADYEYI